MGRRPEVNGLVIGTGRPEDGAVRRAGSQGRGRNMGTIKVAIIGVGNCSAALVQGVQY